ncbi:MAG: NAD-dependent epimerase/dehydratase family protein [Acidimicrobiaceae bacterium]|nr:NAD-dependent epimerase/dehydratase family protein [Acidimicrobiaceae bacterium]MYA00015.1 NAD-dependent epimerase/dehydratase family protein [Acidimicrobiaceae bacterium]MYE76306.1 NAD-dependent epimerase/dehydratase family protein [Acidimicrobiaceae bacterium]MYH42100.1 NAD-dependent epimerase/dehydratase family protein [Acidimicrobiaceae bacterium]MYI54335.1 NAD-dependent epimerase/dehydratase family protein [Acidimicrobiaceae bacterium]
MSPTGPRWSTPWPEPTGSSISPRCKVPFCRADPSGGAAVNVQGTVNVFEAAVEHGGSPVAYASSAAVFGPVDLYPEPVLGPDARPMPATLYGAYKVANEQTAAVYAADHGLATVGLRPFTVYGAGRDQGVTWSPSGWPDREARNFFRLLDSAATLRVVTARKRHAWNFTPDLPLRSAPFLQVIPYSDLVLLLVLPATGVHMLLALMHHTMGAPMSHTGYDAVQLPARQRFELGDFHHQLHHRFTECNYGGLESPLDELIGAFHDGTTEGDQMITARLSRLPGARQAKP